MSESREKYALERGFAQAKEITRKYAKTFYFASLLLPRAKRLAAYSVYAICRLSDETVDSSSKTPTSYRLAQIQEDIEKAYRNPHLDNPLLLAFADAVRKYSIPREYFEELLKGMRQDLEKKRYANFRELYEYCYRAAGVVGLIMLNIFGYRRQQAEDYAIKLGIAMQLTNILRDIKEDLARGRIYLPADEMHKFAVTETDLSAGDTNPRLINLLKFQIERSRSYYAQCGAGIKMISDRRCRLVALAMKEIYAAILKKIERNGYDVFSRRAQVNMFEKIIALSRILSGAKFI